MNQEAIWRTHPKFFKSHALARMAERGIDFADIEHAIREGIVIEKYPEDYPFESMLVLGTGRRDRSIHVVIAVDHKELSAYIITAYLPDPGKWDETFTCRR